jgi:hypothetical protein
VQLPGGLARSTPLTPLPSVALTVKVSGWAGFNPSRMRRRQKKTMVREYTRRGMWGSRLRAISVLAFHVQKVIKGKRSLKEILSKIHAFFLKEEVLRLSHLSI